jgi:hypothetical protein
LLMRRPIRKRAIRRARPCSSLLSPPSRSCRRASAPRCCCATCSVGLPPKPQRCSAAPLLRSTAPCSGRVIRLQNVIRTADLSSRLAQVPRSKDFSIAICEPGNDLIWTTSWHSSKRTRPIRCRRRRNGMRGAGRFSPSSNGLGRHMTGFAWYRQAPTASPRSPPIPAARPVRRGPPTPSTCSRSSVRRFPR